MIATLEPRHATALQRFLAGLPEGDVTFIKEDVRDPEVAARWAAGGDGARRWVDVGDDGAVRAIASVVPLTGWSSHVGEVRLVVDPAARGQGLGRALARQALREALDMGLQKVVVEVVAEQEGAVAMFTELGFRGEALLSCHIRDHSGNLRDLLVLAHEVGEEWASLASIGVEDDLAPQ